MYSTFAETIHDYCVKKVKNNLIGQNAYVSEEEENDLVLCQEEEIATKLLQLLERTTILY